MICSKCGQELKEGAKFCTKCGANFKESMNLTPVNLALPIVSIILSVIGIIGYLVIRFMLRKGNYAPIYWVIQNISTAIPVVGIIVVLIAQKKQNSIIGFIAGLIPCIFLIIIQVYIVIMNLKIL